MLSYELCGVVDLYYTANLLYEEHYGAIHRPFTTMRPTSYYSCYRCAFISSSCYNRFAQQHHNQSNGFKRKGYIFVISKVFTKAKDQII